MRARLSTSVGSLIFILNTISMANIPQIINPSSNTHSNPNINSYLIWTYQSWEIKIDKHLSIQEQVNISTGLQLIRNISSNSLLTSCNELSQPY